MSNALPIIGHPRGPGGSGRRRVRFRLTKKRMTAVRAKPRIRALIVGRQVGIQDFPSTYMNTDLFTWTRLSNVQLLGRNKKVDINTASLAVTNRRGV